MMHESTRPGGRRAIWLLLAVVLALGAACGGDEPERSGASADASPDEPLPPNDLEALAAIYDPLVEPYGVRITRAALIDRDEGYLESDTGTHLALYVEPVDDEAYTTAAYVEGMYEITELTANHAFGTWPSLESYDICQEPWQSEDSGLTPFPVTQIDLTRQSAEDFEWESSDLPGLLDHIDGDAESRWIVSPALTGSPEFQDVNQHRIATAAGTQP